MSETFTTQSGVVLSVKKVPAFILKEKKAQLDRSEPEVPVVHLEDKGRSEPNPNDPGYLKAHERWEEETNTRLLEAMILLGTSIEYVPDSMPKPEDDDWLEELRFLEIPIDESTLGRKLLWLKTHVLTDEHEINELARIINIANGFVPEEDVNDMEDSFRDNTERGTDQELSVEASD